MLNRKRNLGVVFCLVPILFVAGVGAEERGDKDAIDTKKWSEVYLSIAKQFQFETGDQREIKLHPQSLLHWDNPVRVGRTEGDFFVWNDKSRPIMVGTVFSYDSPVTQHAKRTLAFELHTLSDEPISVKRNGTQAWQTNVDSLKPIQLNELAEPRPKRFQRLAEMREIAKTLSATTDLGGVDQPLRLLPKPIYRFDIPESVDAEATLLDGAVFAMVTGTDPELLVFVEARRQADGFAWQLTPARFTNLPIKLKIDGKLIWDDSPASNNASYRPYIGRHRIYNLPTSLGPEALAEVQSK